MLRVKKAQTTSGDRDGEHASGRWRVQRKFKDRSQPLKNVLVNLGIPGVKNRAVTEASQMYMARLELIPHHRQSDVHRWSFRAHGIDECGQGAQTYVERVPGLGQKTGDKVLSPPRAGIVTGRSIRGIQGQSAHDKSLPPNGGRGVFSQDVVMRAHIRGIPDLKFGVVKAEPNGSQLAPPFTHDCPEVIRLSDQNGVISVGKGGRVHGMHVLQRLGQSNCKSNAAKWVALGDALRSRKGPPGASLAVHDSMCRSMKPRMLRGTQQGVRCEQGVQDVLSIHLIEGVGNVRADIQGKRTWFGCLLAQMMRNKARPIRSHGRVLVRAGRLRQSGSMHSQDGSSVAFAKGRGHRDRPNSGSTTILVKGDKQGAVKQILTFVAK